MFQGPQGGNLRYGAFYHRRWLPTLEALGLPPVGLHVLRHSAAARMIQAGGSPKAVQAILGHRSAAFTLSVYGHLFDADLTTWPPVSTRVPPKFPGRSSHSTGVPGRSLQL